MMDEDKFGMARSVSDHELAGRTNKSSSILDDTAHITTCASR